MEYSLADETYAKLVTQLAESKFAHATPELRDNVLQFYSDVPAVSASIQTKNAPARSASLLALLDQLRAATATPRTEAVAAR